MSGIELPLKKDRNQTGPFSGLQYNKAALHKMNVYGSIVQGCRVHKDRVNNVEVN